METHEGFCIREYVSRMRSVNVVKCWPFDEATSEETIKSLLPPISVNKFMWWLDGLQHLHSESPKNVENSKKKKKKKKVQEKGESSFRIENDVEESDVNVGEGMDMVKIKSFKAKAKTPKKRSILEIFAVAPQVERVNSDDNDGDQEENSTDGFCIGSKLCCNEEINWGVKGRRNEKKKKKMNNKKVKKKIKKKKEDNIDLSVCKKVECYAMSKLQDQEIASENQTSSGTREKGNDISSHVPFHKKKTRLLPLDADKMNMAGKALRLIAQNQHQGNPKHGILKDRIKAYSLQQSKKCLLQEAFQVDHFGKQMAEKHVKFLQKDNISRKPSFPVECVKLQKYCGSDVHNVHHACNIGKDPATMETNGTEDVSSRTANEVDARPGSEEQLTIPCCMTDMSTFLKQHNGEEPVSQSVTSSMTVDGKSKHWFDTCLGGASHDPRCACPPWPSCMYSQVNYNSRNTKVIGSSSSSIGGRLNENFEIPGPRFPTANFKDYLKPHNESSVSYLSNLGKEANRMPQASTALKDAWTVRYGTFSHLSPRELGQTLCSQPHWYQKANIHGTRSINGDFIGLPLNSQGEFITLSSIAQGDHDHTVKSTISTAASISLSVPSNTLSKCFNEHPARTSWDCRTSSSEQLNLFPVEDFLETNPLLDITGSHGIGQKMTDLDLINTSSDSLHSENSLCNEDDGVHKSHENEKILSKMRLMGKEFVIGERGVQGFRNEHIWKDKQIIDKFHFSNTSISNAMMDDQGDLSIRKLRETLFVPPETNNHRSGSLYTFPHFDCQTSSMHQNGFVARKINAAEKVYPGLTPCTSSGLYNSKPFFPEPFPSGCNYQILNLELSTAQPSIQDSCPYVSSSDIQLQNYQNLPHAPRSAIRFPFMHPDLERHAQSSWSWIPHESRSPWVFDVSEKGMFVNNFQSYHDSGCGHHRAVPGNNWRSDSSVRTKADDFHLFKPFSLGSTLQTSVGPSSMHPTLSTQEAPMLYYPGAMPISSVWKQHGSQKKIREGIKSRIGIRGLDHGRKPKKQMSVVSNVPCIPSKVPSLTFNEGFQCDITESTSCVNFEDVQNVETALESCSTTKKSKILIPDEYKNDQNEERIYPWIESYSSAARSCPMKLTPGAKHTLEAYHQIDQSMSMSAGSSIPLDAMTAHFKFSESENSERIYKF